MTNSATSKKLIENYENKFNFIKMSRNSEFSDVENFDLLDEKTYFNSNIELNGIVYFPGTINLKQFERLKIEDFEQDLNINVIGLIKILKYYKKQLQKKSSIVLFSTVATKLGMPYHCSTSMVKSAINGITISLTVEWGQILELTVYHHHYLKVICLQSYFPQKNQLKEFQIIIHSKELVIQKIFRH